MMTKKLFYADCMISGVTVDYFSDSEYCESENIEISNFDSWHELYSYIASRARSEIKSDSCIDSAECTVIGIDHREIVTYCF